MIGSLGVPELLFILLLALLVFGPRKLPEIGRTLGRAMGEFRRATSDLKRTLDVELSNEELNKSAAPTAKPIAPLPDPVVTPATEKSAAGDDPSSAEESAPAAEDDEADSTVST